MGLVILNYHRNRVQEWQNAPGWVRGRGGREKWKTWGSTVSPCSNEHCPLDGRLVNISKSGSSLKKKLYKVGNHLCMKESFISSLQRPGMSFMSRRCLKKKMQNICTFLWSYIFLQALFCSFLCLLKLCKALAHPYFYQIGISFHLIPSKSQEWSHPNSPRLQKLCTLLRGGGREYSSSVPLFSTQGLWHKQISPELWCSRWVVWLWSYVIDSELLPKPTSISITHLLKRVNNPGTEAAKWKAAFTTRSRRCNKAMILTFWLGRGGWEDALPLTWEY